MVDADKQHVNNSKKKVGRPWQKGQSGNPKGRPPKDVSLTSLIKEYLGQVPDLLIGGGENQRQNTKTWRELLAQAWLVGAYKGNHMLFKELIERLEGKVPQGIVGDPEKPISITHIIRENLEGYTETEIAEAVAEFEAIVGKQSRSA
jgi:hypothetical protein|tara:strand:+ start:4169 stop:4609 length:441 start_codon:yes stop_codon:yes gene_type:complete